MSRYDDLKKIMFKKIKKHEYKKALDLIRFCSIYKYKLNDVFFDNDLEKACKIIAKEYDDKINESIVENNETILFYDQVSNDNRCLSMHYIEGFIQSGIKFIYVCNEKNKINEKIISICIANNVKVYYLGKRYTINAFFKLIDIYNLEIPSLLFSQNHVDDWIGVIFNYMLKGKCKRYLINISDHVFWIGNNAYDVIVEFRNYGYTITNKFRGLNGATCIKLPYYAFDSKTSFQGLPKEFLNKKIILSGGAVYKTKGTNVFYDIINYILSKYEDTVFLYLGNDAESYVNSKIEEKFKKRVLVLNERSDLDGVMQHAYMYINTFPVIGGLMTLYASKNKLAPFTILDKNVMVNDIRDFYIDDFGNKLIRKNGHELIDLIDYYMNNTQDYNQLRQLSFEKCISKKTFNENLISLLTKDYTIFTKKYIEIDTEATQNIYKKNFSKNLSSVVFAGRCIPVVIRYPFNFVKGFLEAIKKRVKR